MESFKSINIVKLTDTQLYALSQSEFIDPELLAQVHTEIENRQLDTAALKNQWDRTLQTPLPQLSRKDHILLWIFAICLPMVLVVFWIPIVLIVPVCYIVVFFYFRENPLRFQIYWQRSLLSLIAWCIVGICYFYFSS